MSRLRTSLLIVTMLNIFLASLVNTQDAAYSQISDSALGSIRVVKSVPRVALDNRITFLLTIENNGTLPVFELEIFEFVNPVLVFEGALTIRQPSGDSEQPIGTGGVATAVQIIIDPPAPNHLKPGEKMVLQYVMVAPGPSDYQVPAALTWFSFTHGVGTTRLSVYSNGLMVHVPNDWEKNFLRIYPYVLSITTFAGTLTVLLWARERLSNLRIFGRGRRTDLLRGGNRARSYLSRRAAHL